MEEGTSNFMGDVRVKLGQEEKILIPSITIKEEKTEAVDFENEEIIWNSPKEFLVLQNIELEPDGHILEPGDVFNENYQINLERDEISETRSEFVCDFVTIKECYVDLHRGCDANEIANCEKCWMIQANYEIRNLLAALNHPQPLNDPENTEEITYACHSCPKKYTNKYSLKGHFTRNPTHKVIPKDGYKCTYCSKTFKREHWLRDHLRLHTGEKPHKCSVCPLAFPTAKHLTDHLKTHSPELTNHKFSLECEICKKKFEKQKNLDFHIFRMHGTANRPFKCKLCPERFVTEILLKYHLGRAHKLKIFKCDICGLKKAERCKINRHIRDAHNSNKISKCQICGKTFPDGILLRKHIFNDHSEEEKQNECDICFKKFFTKRGMIAHRQKHGQANYECDLCQKKFVYRASILIHIITHLKPNHLECPVCKMKFSLPNNLKSHMTVHRDDRFECDECWKIFKRKKGLKLHKIAYHKESCYFKCGRCGEDCGTGELLKEHLKKMHKPKDEWLACNKLAQNY